MAPGREGCDQSFQPLVKIRDTRQIVEHALVDAQLSLQERLAAVRGFNETPTAQRRSRRESVPIGAGQGRQRQAERRVVPASVPMRGGAERVKISVEFDSRAEQQQIPLERRKRERVAQM